MKTIYKYPLALSDRTVLRLPRGALILSVQVQHGELQLWACIDTGEENEDRTIRLFGTGFRLPANIHQMQFLGTIQLQGGNLVLHAFAEYA